MDVCPETGSGRDSEVVETIGLGAPRAVSRVSKLPTWTRTRAAKPSQGRLVLVHDAAVSGPYDGLRLSMVLDMRSRVSTAETSLTMHVSASSGPWDHVHMMVG